MVGCKLKTTVLDLRCGSSLYCDISALEEIYMCVCNGLCESNSVVQSVSLMSGLSTLAVAGALLHVKPAFPGNL
jgi:hypothetical protein